MKRGQGLDNLTSKSTMGAPQANEGLRLLDLCLWLCCCPAEPFQRNDLMSSVPSFRKTVCACVCVCVCVLCVLCV